VFDDHPWVNSDSLLCSDIGEDENDSDDDGSSCCSYSSVEDSSSDDDGGGGGDFDLNDLRIANTGSAVPSPDNNVTGIVNLIQLPTRPSNLSLTADH